jgi:hypothetical protein
MPLAREQTGSLPGALGIHASQSSPAALAREGRLPGSGTDLAHLIVPDRGKGEREMIAPSSKPGYYGRNRIKIKAGERERPTRDAAVANLLFRDTCHPYNRLLAFYFLG